MSRLTTVRNEFDGAVTSYQNVEHGPSATLEQIKIEALKHYNDRAGSAGIPEEDWENYVIWTRRGTKPPNQSDSVEQYKDLSFLRITETQ